MPNTQPKLLQPYLDAGVQLIPLHRWDFFDRIKGKKRDRGKSPRDNNWTKQNYVSTEQVDHMANGGNVGVRLTAEQLVIDVDPRNFPVDDFDDPINSFDQLCEDFRIDRTKFTHVITGSGGSHYYMTKSPNVVVRDTLPGYDGVEFKTLGRQVVAAGSIHPTSQKVYVWDKNSPPLKDTPAAPDTLMLGIKRPKLAAASGGGEYSQDEIAIMLDALDPEDYSKHEDWIELMQACHHASGGDARSEFIEWSTRDPEYNDHALIIGRRWDSMHADVQGSRITYKTLHKHMKDHGQSEAIPRVPPEDDFTTVIGDDDFGTVNADGEKLEVHEKRGPLETMNERYWATTLGGVFRIVKMVKDPVTGIVEPEYMPESSFKGVYQNKKVQMGDKAVPIAEMWLKSGKRRTVEGVIFDPERDHEGYLNLWTGWAVEPLKGNWSLLRELIHNVLCAGDEQLFEYVINWLAHMFQKPGTPAETAICFQGSKGTGKSTLGEVLTHIAGKHGMILASPEQITGRFNGHLRPTIFMFADEAIAPTDRAANSSLKNLITSSLLPFESKGVDIKMAKNHLHILMASNDDWVLPMSLDDERRFVIQRVTDERRGDFDFFTRLHTQLDNGGYEAFLFDMLTRDLGNFHPRRDLPETRAATEQKIRNLTPVQQWWFNILNDGELNDMEPIAEEADWTFDEVVVAQEQVWESFANYCNGLSIRPGANGRGTKTNFNVELKRIIPFLTPKQPKIPSDRIDIKTSSSGQARCWVVPELGSCRKHFDTMIGGEGVEWSKD